jgi:peptidoglycan/LPS O-acetylase OafA/YrhL
MEDVSLAIHSLKSRPDIDAAANRADAPAPAWLAHGEIPSLHGLRALSILLVLVAHLSQQGILLPRLWQLTELGHIGVDMFFVISGFLITLLLLREQARRQEISLKQFYLRRAFRILPAYLFFLVGIALLQLLNAASLCGWDWFGALTYSVGFLRNPSWDIGHIWSLSVEEHFYLLWPLGMACWPRRGWIVAALTIVLTPALRWLIHKQVPWLHVDYCSLTRMDTIAVGCGLAYLANWAPFRRALDLSGRLAFLMTMAIAVAAALLERWAQRVPEYRILVHPLLFASLAALAIWLSINRPRTPLGAVLNSKPAVAIGILSYGLYLWQQPFLNPHVDSWLTQTPWNVVGFVALASLSYLLVERPFVRWKDRLSRADHPDSLVRAHPPTSYIVRQNSNRS